jgi:5-methyltetrahydrofolate--homocysteine methyltransferase
VTSPERIPFIVIGENVHATRVLLRTGARVAALPDGSPALPFVADGGGEHLLPVPEAALDGAGEKQKVKHVKAACLAGLAGGPAAELGRGYVRHLARRQAEAGASYLDLNVDEVANDLPTRVAAMRWLVGAVEDATAAALSLDSSAPEVLRAGLETATRAGGAPLLNSASLERLDVLDLAAAEGCAVVLGATGAAGMPASAAERVANGRRIVEEAASRRIPLGAMHVDPLVLPVAVEPEVGAWFLEAVRTLRAELGPEVHLTGGLSNVSFGLPLRKLLNDVFIDLAIAAGGDSGIIDPVANDPRRIAALDRSSRGYVLAAALLTGADPYGMEFLTAYRSGELA